MDLEDSFRLPALGQLLPRPRLLAGLTAARPSVVLIEAPAGYGKTTLAYQLANAERFERALWFAGGGQEFDHHSIVQALVWESRREKDTGPTLVGASLSSLEHGLAESLGLHWGRATCVVLDNVVLREPEATVDALEQLLYTSVAADSCLVITSRGRLPLPSGGKCWYLDTDDLRFSADEARAYAEAFGFDCDVRQDLERLIAETSGHPALFAVMVRSIALGRGNSRPGKEIVDQLRFLANSQLNDFELRILRAAAFLRSGSIDDLRAVVRDESVGEIVGVLSDKIPLLRFDGMQGAARFSVHDIGCSVFSLRDFASDEDDGLLARALERLATRHEFVPLFDLLLCSGDLALLAQWADEHGFQLLESGAVPLLQRVLASLPRAALVQRPRVLLLDARLDRLLGGGPVARQKCRLVIDLAENERLAPVALEARVLLARLLIEMGASQDAMRVLEGGLVGASSIGGEARAGVLTHLAAASANLADVRTARSRLAEARSLLRAGAVVGPISELVAFGESYVSLLAGEVATGFQLLSTLMHSSHLDLDTRFAALTNAATALCRLGRLDQAARLLEEAALSRVAEDYTLSSLMELEVDMADISEGKADYSEALSRVSAVLERGDLAPWTKVHAISHLSRASRRNGDHFAALAFAEEARDIAAATDAVPLRWNADIEVFTSLLLLKDTVAARQGAARIVEEAKSAGTRGEQLRAAMLVAEADRLEGLDPLAVLDDLRDHVASGDSNWHVALTIRTFPPVLALLTQLVGPDRLPVHLIEMLRLDGVETALEAARKVLPPRSVDALLHRLGDLSHACDPSRPPQCRVRLFGGLEVEVGGTRIADAAWRKRKARLLFAMLVVRKGRDIPREQLLEYLWPEMDEQRAVANFYVIWNNMKNALGPQLQKGQPLPYARTAGGVCRLDDLLVTSDLDEFERALSELRRAEGSGDTAAAVAAGERLLAIYRGDLLPGDIYDDWFAPLRERCRQEFGDAMLRVARLLEGDGDHVAALQLVRGALGHDAWREDLYQAALRCQIAVGQRSAAIDTYMTCMHKLSEDLGLDPSAETRKLYERVLAMESEEGYAV